MLRTAATSGQPVLDEIADVTEEVAESQFRVFASAIGRQAVVVRGRWNAKGLGAMFTAGIDGW